MRTDRQPITGLLSYWPKCSCSSLEQLACSQLAHVGSVFNCYNKIREGFKKKYPLKAANCLEVIQGGGGRLQWDPHYTIAMFLLFHNIELMKSSSLKPTLPTLLAAKTFFTTLNNMANEECVPSFSHNALLQPWFPIFGHMKSTWSLKPTLLAAKNIFIDLHNMANEERVLSFGNNALSQPWFPDFGHMKSSSLKPTLLAAKNFFIDLHNMANEERVPSFGNNTLLQPWFPRTMISQFNTYEIKFAKANFACSQNFLHRSS